MTDQQKYQLCQEQARQIVASYRQQSVIDAQNFAASTIAAVAAVVAVVASGVSAYGMSQQGKSQERVAKYNAKIQENSAITARQEAEASARQIRDRANRIRGAQVAGASKSGITISGSVNDVMYDSALNSELDALTMIYKGERSAEGLTTQARITRYEGSESSRLATFGAGATLLTGAAQGVGYWSQSSNMAKIEAKQGQPGF